MGFTMETIDILCDCKTDVGSVLEGCDEMFLPFLRIHLLGLISFGLVICSAIKSCIHKFGYIA